MIKTYDDYIDKLCELFPEMDREDIYNIVKFGTKKMFTYISENFDFAIDYIHPKSSVFIATKNHAGCNNWKKIQFKRKEH